MCDRRTTEYQGPDGNTYWWMRDIAFHKWRVRPLPFPRMSLSDDRLAQLIDHKSEFCISESHPQRKNGFKFVYAHLYICCLTSTLGSLNAWVSRSSRSEPHFEMKSCSASSSW
jgi:hypothetical protein